MVYKAYERDKLKVLSLFCLNDYMLNKKGEWK